MALTVVGDHEELSRRAAGLWLDRLAIRPELAMAVPAGRTPRRMYQLLALEARRRGIGFDRMRLFAVDELCPPAPLAGYFWSQVRREFLSWAGVPPERCRPFDLAAPDLQAMCRAYEEAIARAGGLDLIMLGLGPNGHLASNEPGSPLDSRTRPLALTPGTVAYILTDEGADRRVADRAVTLGLATILEAREVVLLVSGAAKREVLRAALTGPVSEACPASVLQRHPRLTVLADREAAAW